MGALIDTSVWIDAFHSKTPVTVKAIATQAIDRPDVVLCEPVYVEFFRGVARRDMKRVGDYLHTVPMLHTPASLWRDALPLLRMCWEKGDCVNTLDALIAVIALKNNATVVTFDQDFALLQKHCDVAVQLLVRPA